MLDFNRTLDLNSLIDKNFYFLFGPRGTGKSSLIRKTLSQKSVIIDLLNQALYARLSDSPNELESVIRAQSKTPKTVVIDEIQKVPSLLDEVHRLIEAENWNFLLTGSSARKLRRSHANLLGGRARVAELYPLVSAEIPKFNLMRALRYGSLPKVYLSEEPVEDLNAYIQSYLTLEIQVEGLIRKLPPFVRFLKVAALSCSQLINYSQIASDCAVGESTVREYFQILTDTFLGYRLEPYIESKKRKAIQTAKFYFFDCGVMHTLAQTEELDRNSDLYGVSLEQFILNEVKAYNSYFRKHRSLYFWREKNHAEVDIIIDPICAIEIKATKRVTEKHLRGLRAFCEEKKVQEYYLVSHDPVERRDKGITFLPVVSFLEKLWSGKVF